jgi:hypothetical protein
MLISDGMLVSLFYPFSAASRPDGTSGNEPCGHLFSIALETMAVA